MEKKRKGNSQKEIWIELDDPRKSYVAGEIISGRVIINSDVSQVVKEVTILLEGSGRVEWTEEDENTNEEETYRNFERYVSEKVSLVGNGVSLTAVQEGITEYPFQFTLPTNLPSSFSKVDGSISYRLEAEIKKPKTKFDKKFTLALIIKGIYNLNQLTGVRTQQKLIRSLGSDLWACRRGNLSFILRVPSKTGFVPGETLDFTCEITNRSSKNVDKVIAKFIQIIKFCSKCHTKTVQIALVQLKGPKVESGEYELWSPHNLKIPPVPPTRLGGVICRIINVQYALRIRLEIQEEILIGTLPIKIGTVPLRGAFDDHIHVAPVQQQGPYPQLVPMGYLLPPQTHTSSLIQRRPSSGILQPLSLHFASKIAPEMM